mmetsp:Transcript_83388/g.232560  ORF Transcript_83388/g.232560 Transcript_83388/m.232560 type:complete len:182 (+) Transcript_83388:110-655(+)
MAAIEFTAGIRDTVGRIPLKKLMEQFGEVEVCHIGTRGVDFPFVRFKERAAADAALEASKAGRVFLDGCPIMADWKGATRKTQPKSGSSLMLTAGSSKSDIPPRFANEDQNQQGMRELGGLTGRRRRRDVSSSRSISRSRSRSRGRSPRGDSRERGRARRAGDRRSQDVDGRSQRYARKAY